MKVTLTLVLTFNDFEVDEHIHYEYMLLVTMSYVEMRVVFDNVVEQYTCCFLTKSYINQNEYHCNVCVLKLSVIANKNCVKLRLSMIGSGL